jgi:hypothetical protein
MPKKTPREIKASFSKNKILMLSAVFICTLFVFNVFAMNQNNVKSDLEAILQSIDYDYINGMKQKCYKTAGELRQFGYEDTLIATLKDKICSNMEKLINLKTDIFRQLNIRVPSMRRSSDFNSENFALVDMLGKLEKIDMDKLHDVAEACEIMSGSGKSRDRMRQVFLLVTQFIEIIEVLIREIDDFIRNADDGIDELINGNLEQKDGRVARQGRSGAGNKKARRSKQKKETTVTEDSSSADMEKTRSLRKTIFKKFDHIDSGVGDYNDAAASTRHLPFVEYDFCYEAKDKVASMTLEKIKNMLNRALEDAEGSETTP